MTLIIGGCFQGKHKWALSHYDEKNIWNHFHLFVKKSIECGKSSEEIKSDVEARLNENPSLVIISDETGCGIVPFTEKDRNYRELTGRLLCLIAEKSQEVIRITCGVAQKIK